MKDKLFCVYVLGFISLNAMAQTSKKPNVIFVLADEWRAQATGFNGDPNVQTPELDRLADSSVNMTNTISCCPVSGPYRASLMTGQYPLTNGFFINDVELDPDANSMGKIYKAAGYETAYIGKWHLDGHGRNSFIPKSRRQGFDYWKVLECTHNYNNSIYWDNNDQLRKWKGYDAIDQTRDAVEYLSTKKSDDKPFLLFLSWGSPHSPYGTAPSRFKAPYKKMNLKLRGNVPDSLKRKAIKDLIGYYSHISALDSCIGLLQKAIRKNKLTNTIFVFTSDHGALLRSHGFQYKQQAYDESIKVPFLINYPRVLGDKKRVVDTPISTPDLLPTLLSLSNITIPKSIEGEDQSKLLMDEDTVEDNGVLIACYQPFGQWNIFKGREYRGVRTKQYTYVKDLKGPWMLFDNYKDPYQMNNLINDPDYKLIEEDLEVKLCQLLDKTNDAFLPGMRYVNKWGYKVNKTGTASYRGTNFKGDTIIEPNMKNIPY